MRVVAYIIRDWCVVIALAIALTFVGFAHRAPSTGMEPELAAYVAAGGQLSDICGTVDGEGAPASFKCEACRIVDTIVLSRTSHNVFRELVEIRTFAFVAKRIAERNDLDPTRLTRGPPQA